VRERESYFKKVNEMMMLIWCHVGYVKPTLKGWTLRKVKEVLREVRKELRWDEKRLLMKRKVVWLLYSVSTSTNKTIHPGLNLAFLYEGEMMRIFILPFVYSSFFQHT
jgi:hypothetical protein